MDIPPNTSLVLVEASCMITPWGHSCLSAALATPSSVLRPRLQLLCSCHVHLSQISRPARQRAPVFHYGTGITALPAAAIADMCACMHEQ